MNNSFYFRETLKKERILDWLAWVEGTIQGILFSIAPHLFIALNLFAIAKFVALNLFALIFVFSVLLPL